MTRELTFAANQIIFKEGDAGNGVYFVKEGLVQIQAVVGQGDLKVLSRIPPGELFGEMAVLDNQPAVRQRHGGRTHHGLFHWSDRVG